MKHSRPYSAIERIRKKRGAFKNNISTDKEPTIPQSEMVKFPPIFQKRHSYSDLDNSSALSVFSQDVNSNVQNVVDKIQMLETEKYYKENKIKQNHLKGFLPPLEFGKRKRSIFSHKYRSSRRGTTFSEVEKMLTKVRQVYSEGSPDKPEKSKKQKEFDKIANMTHTHHFVSDQRSNKQYTTTAFREIRKKKVWKSKIYAHKKTVKEMIEKIKDDEWRMKQFKKRIKEIQRKRKLENARKRNGKAIDFVKKYVNDVSSLTGDRIKKHRLARRTRALELQKQTEKNRQALDKQNRELVVKKMKEEEIKRAKQLYNMKNRPKRIKMFAKQRRLKPLVVYSNFITKVIQVINKGRKVNQYKDRLRKCILIVRKHMLPKIMERRRRKVEYAKRVLKNNMLYWVMKQRIKSYRGNVKTIRNVVKSLEHSNRFSKQVAIYINKVRSAQQMIKNHLKKRESQRYLITKLWNNIQVDVESKQFDDKKEQFRVQIEKYVQNLFNVTSKVDMKSQKSEKAKNKKLKNMAKLQLVVQKLLPPNKIKPRFKENIINALDRLRQKRCTTSELKEAAKEALMPWEDSIAVNEMIKQTMINRDLFSRSKSNRDKNKTLKSSQNNLARLESYFSLFPENKAFNKLIENAMHLSQRMLESKLKEERLKREEEYKKKQQEQAKK